MKRVFLAIDTSDEAKAVASARIALLKKEFPDVRASWVRAENLHITLKFLGDATDEQIDELAAQLGPSFERIGPFTIRLAQPTAFGKRVLPVAIDDPSASMSKINEILETAGESLGFPREKRRFKPHLTLARIRDERGTAPLISKHTGTQIEPVAWEVRDIVLYESKLQPTGSVYSKLKVFPLGPRA